MAAMLGWTPSPEGLPAGLEARAQTLQKPRSEASENEKKVGDLGMWGPRGVHFSDNAVPREQNDNTRKEGEQKIVSNSQPKQRPY